MKTIITAFLVFTLILFSSCQKDPVNSNEDETKIIQLDEKSAQLVEADNAFGLEIFQKIRVASDKENIMISPLSISVALAMAYNGADNDTKAEMEQTLKVNGLTTAQINASYELLIAVLQSLDKDVVFEIADAIFYSLGFSVKQDFLNINQDVYDAEVQALDFSSSWAVPTINSWVADKTHDKIEKIIDMLSPSDRMVLLNAIYFNGIWSQQFDEEGTHMLDFYKTDGSSLEVPMMQKEEKLDYTSNSLFDAVKMPYGNGQYNMVIMLPADGKNSQNIIDNLSASNWINWQENFNVEDHVVVTMPRFKFAFEMPLKNVLKEMGMLKAFDGQIADFSKISDEDLYISSVLHKSFIDVNETGTEAAAVTSITFSTTSAGNEPPKKYLNVNKPFVFAITEKDTGAILFLGEVNHPEYE